MIGHTKIKSAPMVSLMLVVCTLLDTGSLNWSGYMYAG